CSSDVAIACGATLRSSAYPAGSATARNSPRSSRSPTSPGTTPEEPTRPILAYTSWSWFTEYPTSKCTDEDSYRTRSGRDSTHRNPNLMHRGSNTPRAAASKPAKECPVSPTASSPPPPNDCVHLPGHLER